MIYLVRPRKVPRALEEIRPIAERILLVSPVPFSLSVRQNSCSRPRYKSWLVISVFWRAVRLKTLIVIIGAISTILFVLLTYTSSFVTTYLMSLFQVSIIPSITP